MQTVIGASSRRELNYVVHPPYLEISQMDLDLFLKVYRVDL
jgi:hypothetical protein